MQVRLEWGWGPWGALALDRICDWAMRVELQRGRIARFFPCLQSMPFDEQRRHRFERERRAGLAIRSYTARQNAYRENPNQSVVLELEAGADAALELAIAEPVAQTASATLADLLRRLAQPLHRPVPEGRLAVAPHRAARRVVAAGQAARSRCRDGALDAYLRARQKNGHMAWASPVFMNYR